MSNRFKLGLHRFQEDAVSLRICDDASSEARTRVRLDALNKERGREADAMPQFDASMEARRIVGWNGVHYLGVRYQHPYLRQIIGECVFVTNDTTDPHCIKVRFGDKSVRLKSHSDTKRSTKVETLNLRYAQIL